jgi:hypothetical protein
MLDEQTRARTWERGRHARGSLPQSCIASAAGAADTGLGSEAEESADAPAKAMASVHIVCEAKLALS